MCLLPQPLPPAPLLVVTPQHTPHSPSPPAQPVYIVPTAMNYDAVVEEGSLAGQLAGAAKKSESLAGLAGCAGGCPAPWLRGRRQGGERAGAVLGVGFRPAWLRHG